MAEKTEKEKKTATKTPTRAKAPAKAASTRAGEAKAGDLVRIQESRPFSATKRWRLVEVISRAGEAGAAAPRVADISKALEEQEGVTDILTPDREDEPQTEEKAQE